MFVSSASHESAIEWVNRGCFGRMLDGGRRVADVQHNENSGQSELHFIGIPPTLRA